ncbi:MAG TPA: HAD family hydrolase [Actinomycetota bacterium]|nr:HAD family hydrolase [Actinomycetota bacterium]
MGILDVDGTLVDTNYHHAIAWYRAFTSRGVTLPIWRIHRHIGMGGDQLVASLAGDEVEEREGDAIRAVEAERYSELIDEVQPLDGARELIVELKGRTDSVVLASSAKEPEVDHYLDLLDARGLADDWTTSADVEATKPEPDLIHAAMSKGRADSGVMIGDSVWDCEAARRAGIASVAVLTGGFSEQELRDAGASAVFEDLDQLRHELSETPAGEPIQWVA